MMSHEFMNINFETYKYWYKLSDAPSRSMGWLNDIIPIISIIYPHNFYTDVKARIPAFKLYAACIDLSSYS